LNLIRGFPFGKPLLLNLFFEAILPKKENKEGMVKKDGCVSSNN